MIYLTFSALTLLVGRQEGHPASKKLGVGLLVVTIWLQLCTSYSSNCHHHLYELSLSPTKSRMVQNGDILVLAYPVALEKWPLNKCWHYPPYVNVTDHHSTVIYDATILPRYLPVPASHSTPHVVTHRSILHTHCLNFLIPVTDNANLFSLVTGQVSLPCMT